jgi:hypothetical protein
VHDKRFGRYRSGVLETTALAVTVPTGLLFIDGKLVRKLEPGAYAFWNFQKNVSAEVIELRVQTVEVSGQLHGPQIGHV